MASQPAWFVKRPSAETQKLGVIEDAMNYGQRLFHYTYATHHDDVHFLEYRTLHRLNIFHLQNQLAELKGSYWTERDAPRATLGELKTKLHDYSKYLTFIFICCLQTDVIWPTLPPNMILYTKLSLCGPNLPVGARFT